MNKRIFSLLLTLIMLVSLIPAGAMTASAAGAATSESAITVLKQLEGYSRYCNEKGYTGYGTLCPESGTHGGEAHYYSEKQADAALRDVLKDLDKAVNSFASRNGLGLSQGQHDALVLFSFQNGTAWTTGTGAFQNAVKSRARGSEFLDAICRWNETTADDSRRKIEANMYLNGVYNTYVPSRYITVTYEPNGGTMSEFKYQYYDTAENPAANIIPSYTNHFFMGWYTDPTEGKQVTSLKSSQTLYAHWQSYIEEPGDVKNVSYLLEVADRTRLYDAPKGNKTDYHVKGNLTIDSEFIDNDNNRWAHVCKAQKLYKKDKKQGEAMATDGWIKLGTVGFNSATGNAAVSTTMDVTVTVTNSYLRVRAEDSIYSKELRQLHLGDQARIVNTSSGDGFLWGQIADADDDGVCEGWIALMYTNYEEVRTQDSSANVSYNVIATATVVKPVNGYVNVRSDAGTNNQIVGALPYQSRVDIYEITYVNGIQWGRYSGGWFCLAYADVTGIDVDDYANNSNVLAYAFNGKYVGSLVYTEPDETSKPVQIKDRKNLDGTITVTNLTEDDLGNTWGKIPEGWLKVTNADGTPADVILNIAKYYTVVDGVTVRTAPSTSAERVNNLVKGVEFNVNDSTTGKKQILVKGDTIWGFADKVGEDKQTYSGWINLASKYVARGDAPASAGNNKTDTYTGEMATIVGADKVNVRIHHDIYAKILGKIPYGTTVAILGEEDGWYKLDYDVDNNSETDSWVSAKYVEVSKAPANNGGSGSTGTGNGTGSVETGLGIVANTYSGVNVRTAPGTGNPQVGKLLPGTTVEILEVTTRGASKWGRVKEGWICMDYVTMVNNYEILAGLVGGTGGSTGSTITGAEVAIYTGTVNADIKIHKNTTEASDVVRELNAGEPVTVHEILTVTNEKETVISDTKVEIEKTTEFWARVNDGYIKDPAICISLDTLDEAVYTVTGSETLNVRPGAGTASGAPIFKLTKGDQVVITKVSIVGGNVWGFIEADAEKTYITDEDGKQTAEYDWDGEGWISLAYTTKGAVSVSTGSNNSGSNNDNNVDNNPVIGAGSDVGGMVTNTSGYRYTGKVINTASLNVRATASQTATKTTTLSQGASLVIYETVISEGMAWGRCDAGWVYLYYVDLTPVVNGAVDARVVYNENTIAYTDMNCSAVAGTYSKMSVVDIYEIVGKMARTELGWVNTDNLL